MLEMRKVWLSMRKHKISGDTSNVKILLWLFKGHRGILPLNHKN